MRKPVVAQVVHDSIVRGLHDQIHALEQAVSEARAESTRLRTINVELTAAAFGDAEKLAGATADSIRHGMRLDACLYAMVLMQGEVRSVVNTTSRPEMKFDFNPKTARWERVVPRSQNP